MKKKEVISGTVRRVEFPNKGIIETSEGKVVVKGVLPDQKVSVQIQKVRKDRAEGRLLEVLEESPDYVESPCIHFGKCGGCSYLTMPYVKQLGLKEQQVRSILKPAFERQSSKVTWEGIKTVFSVIVEWFGTKFTEAWTAVKAVFSTGGQIFDGIKEGITSAFKTVVNAIIRGINKVIAIPFNAINNTLDRIRNINIAGAEPFSGLISRFDVPKIPELREGGVLKKGQVGFLEGDGDEAVVPLEKNTRWIDEVADRISRNMGVTNQYNSSVEDKSVTNNFYQTNNSPKALSRLEIYRQSKNLLKTLS